MKLKWLVFRENINTRKIEEFDIFRHSSFAEDVDKLLKEHLNYDEFAEELRHTAQYYFWAKSEHEVVVCSWPVYIDKKELARLNEEIETRHYAINVKPTVGIKVDIYMQLMLNWKVFVDYVWSKGERK